MAKLTQQEREHVEEAIALLVAGLLRNVLARVPGDYLPTLTDKEEKHALELIGGMILDYETDAAKLKRNRLRGK